MLCKHILIVFVYFTLIKGTSAAIVSVKWLYVESCGHNGHFNGETREVELFTSQRILQMYLFFCDRLVFHFDTCQ